MIVHRIIWNNQFAVGIEKKKLALGDRLKKMGSSSESHRFPKENKGSLGDSSAEYGGS